MKCRCYSNFDREAKFKGIIDYKSLFILLTYMVIVFKLISIFNLNIEYKIYIYIFLTIPIIALIMTYSNNDNVVGVLFNIIKYCFKRGIYLNLD